MYYNNHKMTPEEERLARASIAHLETHGLTLEQNWHINGEPSVDIADYLNGEIEDCFPADAADLTRIVLALIERQLPPYRDEEEPVSE
jgi:hypothetical protein